MTQRNIIQRWYLYGQDDLGDSYDALCRRDNDGEWCLYKDVVNALDTLRSNAIRVPGLIGMPDWIHIPSAEWEKLMGERKKP
jgi:hypothetical protein